MRFWNLNYLLRGTANLAPQEGINTYVTLILDDPVTGTQHKFSCPTVLGESNPRYEFKADFVNVGSESWRV